MRSFGRIAALVTAMTLFSAADAGHEAPVYPAFYPQEIRIGVVEEAAAAKALTEGRIQAYVGRAPNVAAGEKTPLRFVESLGGYWVVRLNPDALRAADAAARCALAGRAVAALASGEGEGFRFHPYPVNPMHADYFRHFDLAVQAKERLARPGDAGAAEVRLHARGDLAERLAGSRRAAAEGVWDARLELTALDDLLAPHRFAMNGWEGPPWLKQGWFHAYLLLAPSLDEPQRRQADDLAAKLQQGNFQDGAEQTNAERNLLRLLTGDCRTMIAGYQLRRWRYNADYSVGVENIAYDSHAGFHSAIFLRTVKLKDFPWNGWLALGVPDAAEAAWNPFGGFSDDTGRLVWLTLGDPALFPEPYNAGWSLNRIGEVSKAADAAGPARAPRPASN